MKNKRSFLKWAGNKYNCLNNILSEFPDSKRLIEPFTGSGTIFLNTNYASNILAEENLDLINLFKCLQTNGHDFIEYAAKLFCQENNNKEKYYKLREEFNAETEILPRSALFLYLNKHGFNGLCRYNSSGIFNVPFGRYTKPYYPRTELENFIARSKKARFVHGDFMETFAIAKPGDFIYCDPPYSPIEQASNFSGYTSKKFNEEEHIKLANAAKSAAAKGVRVIISNHDTPFTRQQYAGSQIKSFLVGRYISRSAGSREPVRELIAIF